jgi:hypothetical protein
MKAIVVLSVALIAGPLVASPVPKGLPGVSDKEAVIPYADIRQSVRGHGDVFFVRDRANQWYRVQVNQGCAQGVSSAEGLVIRRHGPGSSIDRFATVAVPGAARSCAIRSIRKSEPPPQIDSKSKVTLD